MRKLCEYLQLLQVGLVCIRVNLNYKAGYIRRDNGVKRETCDHNPGSKLVRIDMYHGERSSGSYEN